MPPPVVLTKFQVTNLFINVVLTKSVKKTMPLNALICINSVRIFSVF